ncbi:NmrA family protein [Nemania sp. FL0916]|nr:NmrA family protein [Nemania sp. FL0916]
MATYLITQATGQQAQWTIRHLLASGAQVHALVRDPSKLPSTSVLKQPGITIFKGESVNFEDVYLAAQGCVGAYLNTYPIPGLETTQAQTVLAASRKAGIKSVVALTTMCTANTDMWQDDWTQGTPLRDYFVSKASVEDAVRNNGSNSEREGGGEGKLTWTILRPAFIHIDYLLPTSALNFPRLATHGLLDHDYAPETRMPHTDCSDIGRYACAALLDPAKFAGQEIELSNELLTIEESREIISRVSGREVRAERVVGKEGEVDLATLFHTWANRKDFGDVVRKAKQAEKRFGMEFTSFEDALRRDRDRVLESLPAEV